MARELDTNTCHTYLTFIAGEAKRAMQGEKSTHELEIDLKTFERRCKDSRLPENVLAGIRVALANYYHRTITAGDVGVWVLDIAISTMVGVQFDLLPKRHEGDRLQGLKLDMEALAMHIKLHY